MDDNRKMITWTVPMVHRFEKAYESALRNKQKEFKFDDNEFVTNYAKYLLEYLKDEFKLK